MEIKILGTGCSRCGKTEKLVKKTIADCGIDAKVEKVTDMLEIAGYGVLSMPAVVVDGEVKISGKVPSKAEIESCIKK